MIYLICPTCEEIPSSLNPFRTVVPFWGQSAQVSSSLCPKRDCGSERVNLLCVVVAVVVVVVVVLTLTL